MNNVYITRASAVLPNAPVSNEEIENVLGKVNGQASRAKKLILRSNKIKSRHYVVDQKSNKITHTNAQLTAESILKLEDKFFSLKDIDCISTGTSTPDQILPNHGVMVHGELKNPPCEVVSTSGICLSGVTALKYIYNGVKAGEYRYAVSTGSDVCSILTRSENFEGEIKARVDELEKKPTIAFEKDFLRWMLSDGSGAFLLEPQPRKNQINLKIEWIEIFSYANEMETCMYQGCEKQEDGSIKGYAHYSTNNQIRCSIFAVQQDIKLLNKNAIGILGAKTLQKVVDKHGLTVSEVDYFLPHISSFYFKNGLYENLKNLDLEIPEEKWFTNLSTKGNTGAASIYIMIEELFNGDKLKKGDTLLCGIPESGRFSCSYMLLKVV